MPLAIAMVAPTLRAPRARPFLTQRRGHIFEHIFNKDAVARRGVADEDVCDRPHDLAVLHDGAA